LSIPTIEQWADFLKRGKPRSRIEPPHIKQKNLISYLFQPDGNRVKQVDLCCGRGFGKSFLSIFVATMALSLSPYETGLFLEPDWKRVRRVFLKKWRQIVPSDLYELNKSEQCITWKPTGSLLFYGPRNITGSYEGTEDSQLGQDTTFVIDDEAALRCSSMFYTNTLATIREPSNVRFYLTTSTPRVGDYQDLVTSEGHKLFRGTSEDNPYLPDGYVDLLKSNMSPEQAERELYGRFVALEGRVWKSWSDDPWPSGNVHPHEHEHERPYYLFFDPGVASGAWVVVQQVQPIDEHGRRLWERDPVWVVTAELMPKRDGAVETVLSEVDAAYGRPLMVVAGADVNKRSDTDSRTPAMLVTNVWGQVPVIPIKGWMGDKILQHGRLNYGILDTRGRRSFCVSKNLIQHYPKTKRGILQLMKEDTWPEKGRNFMEKEGRLEHVRDALLYGAIGLMFKPSHGLQKALAA
jgi:hypothetical protein